MKCTAWTFAVVLIGTALLFPACSQGPAGPVGTSYTPPAPLCSSPVKYGLTTTPATSSFGSQSLRCSPITLATAATAINLSMHVSDTTPTGQARMGIYSDSAGYPNRLIVQTLPANLAASSWNTISLPYNMYLPSGTYWLVHLISDSNDLSYQSASVASAQIFIGYEWAALPETFPPAANVSNFPYCINVGVCP